IRRPDQLREALFFRKAADRADQAASRRQPEFFLGLLDFDLARVFLGVDRILNELTTLRRDAARQATLVQVTGDTDDRFIARQTNLIDRVVKRCTPGVLDPAMDGRNQSHGPQITEQKPEQVTLVIVSMPDLDALATTDAQKLREDTPVPGAAIENRV